MKRIIISLSFGLIFVSRCFGIVDSNTSTDYNFFEDLFSSISWKSTAALNEYSNFKTGFCFERSFFETEFYSISTITSIDKKSRVSSNILAMMAITPLITGPENGNFLFLSLFMPTAIGNAKIYIPIINNRFYIGGGLNTDYYLFYKKSVVYSEKLVGVKYGSDKVKIYIDYRYPFNGCYLKNKEPYLSISFSMIIPKSEPKMNIQEKTK